MKFKLLILSFIIFAFSLKFHSQECPSTVENGLVGATNPPIPEQVLNLYYMAFNTGSVDNIISYTDIVIEGKYTSDGGLEPKDTPVNITYTKAGSFEELGNYFIQYNNPNPAPWMDGAPKIDLNNFTVISFGPGLGQNCIYIDQVLPINDFKTIASVSLYPNPIKKGAKLHFNSVLSADIFDMTGKIVLKFENTKTGNISDLSQGIYIIKMQQGKTIFTRKLIVTN